MLQLIHKLCLLIIFTEIVNAYIDPGTGYTISSIFSWLSLGASAFLGFFIIFFKTHKKWLLPAFVSIGLLLITLLSLGIMQQMQTPIKNQRTIILGFDGMSPDILERLMAEHKLPNFSKLKNNGSFSPLATTMPPQSPVAWAAFATGQNPGKTGIYDFIVRDPKNYELTLALSNFKNGRFSPVIKHKKFWQYLSDKNIPSIILNAPLTFPPDKIKGKILAGMGVTDILGTEGTFSFYTTEQLDKERTYGGNVYSLTTDLQQTIQLLGPKTHPEKNLTIPCALTISKNTIIAQYQKQKTLLQPGQWSDWQTISFNISPFKKMHGLFKFYLVSTTPEIKLYMSPINYDPHKPFFTLSHPKKYAAEIAKSLGLFNTRGIPFENWGLNEERIPEQAFLSQVKEIQQFQEKLLFSELQKLKTGVLFAYFGSTDIIQHMFWREEKQITIEQYYIAMDALLGKVMQHIQKEDTLIVLSDHGFAPFTKSVHINTWLHNNGYLELKDASLASGAELLSDVDWQNTQAYATGFGALYINQYGREKNGSVQPGTETEKLIQELSKKLKSWKDPQAGKNIVHSVYTKQQLFTGKQTEVLPDLYIGFERGYRASWQTALGACPEQELEPNNKKWSGDHLYDAALVPGIILTNKKIKKTTPSIMDIAPTILQAYNIDTAQLDMDGSSLFK